jgi:xanthine/uracil permease
MTEDIQHLTDQTKVALLSLEKMNQYTDQRLANLLVQFVILWAIVMGSGFVVKFIQQIWSLIGAGIGFILGITQPKFESRSSKIISWVVVLFFSIVSTMVNWLSWVVQLFIFMTLVIPFLYEIAPIIGNPSLLRSAVEAATRLNFTASYENLSSFLGR